MNSEANDLNIYVQFVNSVQINTNTIVDKNLKKWTKVKIDLLCTENREVKNSFGKIELFRGYLAYL